MATQVEPVVAQRVSRTGKKPIALPAGLTVTIAGSKLTIKINGQTVNECQEVYPAAGRILLQTEGHEIYFRKFEIGPINGSK